MRESGRNGTGYKDVGLRQGSSNHPKRRRQRPKTQEKEENRRKVASRAQVEELVLDPNTLNCRQDFKQAVIS